jgi:hypothetical protein
MTQKSRVSVSLKDNEGEVISAWTSVSWRDHFTDPLGQLDVEARPTVAMDRARYRSFLAKGRLVALFLNDIRQATMLVTGTERIIGREGVIFRATAKGVLTTAFEGSADPYLAQNFDSDTPVADAVLTALTPYGFDIIQITAADNIAAMTGKAIDNQQADVVTTELEQKDIQVQANETAYGFGARIYTRLGLLLKTDVNGLLTLFKPDYQQAASYTLLSERTLGRSGDRMLSDPAITIKDSNDGQFSEIVLVGKEADKRGQKSATAPTSGIIIADTTRPSGIPFEKVQLTEIPAGRNTYVSTGGAAFKPKYRFDKKARDKTRALVMATVMHGARSQNAYQIQCTVDGMLSSTGAIWTAGTIARVIIDEEGIDDDMWILECTKSADIRGQRTALTLIPKGALILGEA